MSLTCPEIRIPATTGNQFPSLVTLLANSQLEKNHCLAEQHDELDLPLGWQTEFPVCIAARQDNRLPLIIPPGKNEGIGERRLAGSIHHGCTQAIVKQHGARNTALQQQEAGDGAIFQLVQGKLQQALPISSRVAMPSTASFASRRLQP